MTDDTRPTDDAESTDRTTNVKPDTDWPAGNESLAPLADRLAGRTVTLDGTDPTGDLDDLAPITDYLEDARVVGLGEATHGTREFFQLKHRLIRALVERLDYRLVAMEANFAETLAVDEYVVHGRGDPGDALDGIRFWTWDTEEVLALVEWLREFNAGRPVDDRVRFYGVDAQFTGESAAALQEFFAERDPDWLDAHREPLAMLADEELDVEWDEESDDGDAADETDPDDETADDAETAAQLADAEAVVDAAVSWFGDCGPGRGSDTFELHRRHARVLAQAVEFDRHLFENDLEAAADARDRAMAQNLAWVLDHEHHDRVALWAHDEHVRRGVRDQFWGTAPSMGDHLAERYGGAYYAVGFDFADGEFQAIGPAEDGDGRELRACSLGPPPEDAATRLFATVDESVWFVDFEAATADERLADYFDGERPVRSVGAVYDPDDEHDRHHDRYRLPEAFDGLLFVADTGSARPIERE